MTLLEVEAQLSLLTGEGDPHPVAGVTSVFCNLPDPFTSCPQDSSFGWIEAGLNIRFGGCVRGEHRGAVMSAFVSECILEEEC